jgi:hypothetical protein
MTGGAVWLVVGSVGVVSCTKANPAYCDDTTGQSCASGYRCIDHGCVPEADASVAPDGPSSDARGPIVRTYQAADLVLGQSDFTADDPHACTSTSIRPISIGVAQGRTYGGDIQNRVLIWDPIPTVNNVAPALVMGQPDFTTCAGTSLPTPNRISAGHSLFATGDRVLVTDLFLSRVRIWNSVGSSNEAADLVLGQPSLSDDDFGTAADQLSAPIDVWSDGVRVIVADAGNNRVLIWNTFPTANQQPADVVVGYPGFGQNQDLPPSASTLRDPTGVWCDGVRLFVADRHNRVLIWNSIPTTNGRAADVVLGAPSFDQASPADLSRQGFGDSPTDIVTIGDALFVADPHNDRVMVWSPIPSTNGADATYVLGQPDFTTGGNDPSASARSLDFPSRLAVEPGAVWVSDEQHDRILRYQLYPE